MIFSGINIAFMVGIAIAVMAFVAINKDNKRLHRENEKERAEEI